MITNKISLFGHFLGDHLVCRPCGVIYLHNTVCQNLFFMPVGVADETHATSVCSQEILALILQSIFMFINVWKK